MTLSVFLIVKNEEQDLPACLTSITPLADEIIVVDDCSTDQTVSIAQTFGATVLRRALDGFGTQKQFALDHTTSDWALSLDADERITPSLATEIRRTIRDSQAAAGYEVRREFYFLGHRLRFGGQGSDWVLRLFKRGTGHFLPRKVHERVHVQGRVARLTAPLEHYSYATLDEYTTKCRQYTDLAARERFARGRRFSALDHLRPGWELFARVVLKSAWLDGQPGLMYAVLSSHAVWLRAMRLWELEHGARRSA